MSQKTPVYRNRRLLQTAKNVPFCFGCGRPNDGSIVACHSNQGRDGKAMGMKSHDYRIAFLCSHPCHYELDEGKDLTRMQKIDRFEKAHRESIGWLFESGTVMVK